MSSDSIKEKIFGSFPYASRIPSFKGSCNSKQFALTSKFNLSVFGCYIVPSTKKWRYRNKPGTNFAICTYDERLRII